MKMEDFIPNIKSFDKRKLRHIDILNNSDSKSNWSKVYKEILKGTIKSDDDLAMFLYKSKAAKKTAKFDNFKKEFIERVLNTFLFTNTEHSDWDDVLKFKFEANRRWLIIKNVSFSQLNYFAKELAEKLLLKTIEFEYTEITLELLGIIKAHYSLKGDVKLFEETQNQFDYFENLLFAERKARSYKEALRVCYAKSAAYQPENAVRAKDYHEALTPFLQKYSSFSLHLNAFLVEVYIYSTVNDYAGWLEVAERGIEYLKSRSFGFDSALAIFVGQKAVTSTYLKKYGIAEEAINESIATTVKFTFNWFKQSESKMFLLFRMKRYKEAHQLYNEVISISEFHEILHDMNLEMWNLFPAYLYLLNKLGKINETVFNIYSKEFRTKKFLNEVPAFDSDKDGMNLSLVIMELCDDVVEKKWNDIEGKGGKLKKYILRHIDKNEPTLRFEIFLKMLLEFPKLKDEKTDFTNNNDILLSELKSYDKIISENIYRLEIIEFEVVWQMLLDVTNGKSIEHAVVKRELNEFV